MQHRNYCACVEYDSEDRLFVGKIAGINDTVGFHGDTAADLENAFKQAVDDYVEACARVGKSPERP